ncbi:hypothetical protein VE03_09896 [Pseudogymnoascus sp. 23342-1-I1]|nr:hypothetical protein VE03_09896 [Pseudogymnoascus sp. 23342-1-I1]
MGYPDVHCPICGGPVIEVKIFVEPSSDAYKAYVARRCAKDPSYQNKKKKNTYDGKIISREEVRWTATVMVLGFNSDFKAAVNVVVTNKHNNAFLATIGMFDGFVGVTVHDSFDPYFNLGELGEGSYLEDSFPCYRNLGEESDFEPVFPFHRPCYYVLRRRIDGRIDGTLPVGLPLDVEKDILFGVMRTLVNTNMLNIDYGRPNPKSDETGWHANTGEEIFAADPGLVIGLEDKIRGMMNAGYFAPSRVPEFDLSNNVRHDPFQRMPFDIFLEIAEQCEDPTH